MELIKHGKDIFCSTQILDDKQFLRTILRYSLDCSDLYHEPALFNEVMEQNQELPDWILHHFGEFSFEHQPTLLGFEQLHYLLKSNARFVVKALSFSWLKRPEVGLQHTSKDLQDNLYVVVAFIKNLPNNFQYASARLRDNKELVLWLVERYPAALKYA